MGRWLDHLRKRDEILEMLQERTDKTDNTGRPRVSSVLSVVVPGKIENSTSGGAVSSLGFVSFVSPVSGHAQNFRVRSEHDEDLQDAFEERAAILEFDQEMPRAQAEALARKLMFGPKDEH